MQLIKVFLSLGLLATTLAAPTPSVLSPTDIDKRQSRGATCGSRVYSSSAISKARSAGCDLQQSGDTVGSNDYPHRYNNYEGFDLEGSSPWYEFPILASGQIFDGSTSPGPDRVIFNGGCQLAGVLTHTGASGNSFLECRYA